MAFEFKLPDVGEGIHEAEIVRWLVAEGDYVEEDQPLVEVQTDKAVVELPSPKAGVITRLHFAEGDIVNVGEVIVTIAAEADAAAMPINDNGKDGRLAADEAAAKAAAASPAAPAAPAPAPVPATPGAAGEPRRRVLATPATRRLARELGIDIQQVPGTGPGGRVTDEDVRNFAARPAAAAQAVPPAAPAAPAAAVPVAVVTGAEPEERIPIRGIRKTISERMVQSKFTAPHVTLMDEVDVTDLVKIRREAAALAQERGIKLSYLPFIIKATIAGLREFPYLNSSVDDDAGEIVLKRYYHIGIATDTEAGLMVPVIRHADQKSIFQLAAEIDDLAARARSQRINLDELRGSTFTLTNAGAVGGVYSTPIINYPEVAILGIHRIKEKPAVVNGEIVPRHMLTLALSFDHRIIDGAYAARFMNRVMSYLEQPSLLFMELI